MSRISFRSRPVDIDRQLPIVRDPTQLDGGDGVSRNVAHGHQDLDRENEKVQRVTTTKGTTEIPTPNVEVVETYEDDYKPIFDQPIFYVRKPPFMEATTESFVEYDLDEEDEEWLAKYNDGQERLSGEKLEFMIMKLEHICAEITDKAFVAAGASAAERNSAAASASTSHLSREDALAALKCANMRQAVNVAVYEYWVEKRKQKERPLMRRFQPPPPVTDSNPYTVFRAREKIQRPQTRRKRENDVSSYEKMREMRFNMARAREILAAIVTRERRKQDILMCEVKLHTLQIRLRHDARNSHEKAELSTWEWLKQLESKQDAALPVKATAFGGMEESMYPTLMDAKKSKKKRALERLGRPEVPGEVPPFPTPPEEPEVEMLFLTPPPWDRLAEMRLPPEVDRTRVRPRIGRGGRIIFDRADPFTWEPFPPREIPKGTVEMLDAAMALSPAVSEDSSMIDAEIGEEHQGPVGQAEVGMEVDRT
mmetsp:Transcript_118/g.896  ORF Transcript_118/g.896 Transcript_118/m.896 type:complete len:481 (-) Transcript_118:584-2026(-)